MIFSLRHLLLAAGLTAILAGAAFAVSTDGGYVTTPPTVENWDTGWGAPGISGWDYVGQVGGASGVYLGNNWVVTAAHVGPGSFTTAGITYSYVPGTVTTITNADGTADLVLFQIATAPTLPSLTIRTSDPLVESTFTTGSTVVMIGFGGGQGRSWGANLVTGKNYNAAVGSWISTTFYTRFGEIDYGTYSINNHAMLESGDSGGAAFIYNSSAAQWELAGINEAVGIDDQGNSYSFLTQLNVYAAQINAITATPVPESGWSAGIGVTVVLIAVAARLRRRFRPGRFGHNFFAPPENIR